MHTNPLLTIAIPTYNRLVSLNETIKSLYPLVDSNDVEIVITDNFSDDGTWEWLVSLQKEKKLHIRRNVTNLGIEGNIIQSLLSGTGKYVWLLSDHMIVYPSEVSSFLEKLRTGLDFDLGYARISAYKQILPSIYIPEKIVSIDQYSLGNIIFCMGNISAFLGKRMYINQCARSLFRFAAFTYPHLGVFLQATNDLKIIELPALSEFCSVYYGPKHYDTFRSRFIEYVRATEQIRRLNPNFGRINKALKTRLMLLALVTESVSDLCFENNTDITSLEYLFCFRHYPGKLRFFLLLCAFLSIWPDSIKKRLSRITFRATIPSIYRSVARTFSQHA